MRTPRPPRGITLIEILITVAVTLIVISGAVVSMRAQQRAYLDGRRLRDAQTSARRALLAFEKALPNAGFGMDAALAFDFTNWTTGPCPTQMGSCADDSTSTSDELTFFARDNRYWVPSANGNDLVGNAWRIQSVSSSQVVVAARPGDRFLKGQIFLGVCPGASTYAYFTAASTATASGATNSFVTIPLVSAVATNPFLRQDVAAAATCFTVGGWASATTNPPQDPPRLFLIDKYRFHVRPVAVGAVTGATRYDPLLVLDRGLDLNGDGVVDDQDEVILAEGIESLQVAYTFYNPAIAQAGVTAGTAVTETAGTAATATTTNDAITTTTFPGTIPAGQTAYQPSSFYSYTYGPPPDPARNTNHQANVQLVRIAVLARSIEPDTEETRRIDQLLPVLNQNAAPAWITSYATALGGHDGYQRIVLETTVPLPNMASRAMPYF